MFFIYKLEVSNGGKEKVVFCLAATLAWEHLRRQRDPGSPETSLHPLRGVLGPGRGSWPSPASNGCVSLCDSWEVGLLSRSTAYQLTLPYLSFQRYPLSFSGVNRKISFASRQLPSLGASQLSPLPNHTQGCAANRTGGRWLIHAHPSPCQPNFPSDRHREHTDISSRAPALNRAVTIADAEGFAFRSRHGHGLKRQETHLVFCLHPPSLPSATAEEYFFILEIALIPKNLESDSHHKTEDVFTQPFCCEAGGDVREMQYVSGVQKS